MRLKIKLIVIICAGNDATSSNFLAPKYFEMVAEMAERVCAKIQIIAEIKEPAMPTAASASVGFSVKFPTMAVSVIESKGSAIPAIMAGIANLLIPLNVMFDLLYIHYFFVTVKRKLTLIGEINTFQFYIIALLVKLLISFMLA